MKIETKFDIGQEVYRIYDLMYPEILEFKIEEIILTSIGITYSNGYFNIYEEELFSTKEEAEQKLEEIKNEQSNSV